MLNSEFPKTQIQSIHDRAIQDSYIAKNSGVEARAYDGAVLRPETLTNETAARIDKYIEIVMIPGNALTNTHIRNVGITLNAPTILEILSERYKKVCVSVIETEDDLKDLIEKNPDLVFSGIKYFHFYNPDDTRQKNVWFSDYLAEHNIAYIGSTANAYRNSYDKVHAKEIVRDAGIRTAHFFTTQPDELAASAHALSLPFPLFAKPDEGGDSRGVDENSIVTDFAGLKAKVSEICQNQQQRSLVESYLSGKEYTVGVFENIVSGMLTAMPIEIVAEKNRNGDRILDFSAKKNDTEQVIEVTDLQIHKLVSDLAIQVFRALQATSHTRIDIKMDEHGVPHFLEGNLMPGLAKGYLYRSCALNQKMSYAKMLYTITENALARHSSAYRSPELDAAIGG